jgi:iron complex transport system substrate-binding protein
LIYAFSSGSASSSSGSTVSITDVAGRNVQIPAQVNKVVGTGCSGREIVYLNASDKIVGIEQVESNSTGASGTQLPYIIAHSELMGLPIVGDASKNIINYEEIAELHPDVVFARSTEDADSIQNKTGIPAVVVYTGAVGTPEQMNTYEKSLRVMGKVLGKEKRAEELISYIGSLQEDLSNRAKNTSNSSKPTVYVGGQAYKGAHGITSTNPYYPAFEMLNASNVASAVSNNTNATSNAIQIDPEQLITWNPDIIFIEGRSLEVVKNDTSKNPNYNNLKAVKDGNVYGVLAYCMYSYNKEEMFANAYYIGKVIYPEQFKDVNPEEKAGEIFTNFDNGNGASIYSSLKTVYGGFEQLNL